jgi:hypothetical protein
MIRRLVGMALLLLLLVACGGGDTSTNAPAAPAAPAASTAAAGPEATVEKALTAMSARDEATLTDMFDQSVGNLRNTLAFQAIRDWNSMQSEARLPPLGPVQSRQIQAPETRGQTTVVVVNATHQKGSSVWEFQLRQADQGWNLLEIHGTEK